MIRVTESKNLIKVVFKARYRSTLYALRVVFKVKLQTKP